jgi:hypothetical protein
MGAVLLMNRIPDKERERESHGERERERERERDNNNAVKPTSEDTP